MDRNNKRFPTDPKRYRVVEIKKPGKKESQFNIQVLCKFLWMSWWESVTLTYHAVGSAGDNTEKVVYHSKEKAERQIYLWINRKKIAKEEEERRRIKVNQIKVDTKITYHDYKNS